MHVVDGSLEQPEYEFDAVCLELEMFSPEIAEKAYIVVFNKMDLPEAYEKWPSFRERLKARGIEPYCMSAVTRDGTQDVIYSAYELVRKNKEAKEEEGLNYYSVPLKYLLYSLFVVPRSSRNLIQCRLKCLA